MRKIVHCPQVFCSRWSTNKKRTQKLTNPIRKTNLHTQQSTIYPPPPLINDLSPNCIVATIAPNLTLISHSIYPALSHLPSPENPPLPHPCSTGPVPIWSASRGIRSYVRVGDWLLSDAEVGPLPHRASPGGPRCSRGSRGVAEEAGEGID